MGKSIIIIGGGLTGLSAGCYGRMNGYKTTVFEMHSIPGGVCTAWKRKGYSIDGAVNWVMGTNPSSSYYRFWQELGAAPNWKIYNHDLLMTVENREGKALNLYCNADRLEKYLLEIAPEDSSEIKKLTSAIRRSSTFNMFVDKPAELYSVLDGIKALKALPLLRMIKKWSKISIGDFAGRLKNSFLREILLKGFQPDWPMTMLVMLLGFQHAESAGYITGGALALTGPIEKRYLDLGGDVQYNSRVEKILVENERAVGVRLADGSEHRADWVISAADGRTTIFGMLEGKYVDSGIAERYENPKLFEPLVYVSLGITRQYNDLLPSISGLIYPLDKPIIINGKEEKQMFVRSYRYDPTMAPEGKDVLIVQFETDYDYWRELYSDPKKYKAEKKRIAEDVISGLEQRFPGIPKQIEMIDVATPVTWERYTGNWRGSYEGWQFDMESFSSRMKKTLPGLQNFYMAGQWVNPGGGIPTAVMSGSHTIQMICRKDKKKFAADVPKG